MDKRLIFRYRSWTIQSFIGAGCAKPSAALELLRLSVQKGCPSGQFFRDVGKPEATMAIWFTLCLQEKPVKGCQERPYRKPTLVAGHKYAKVDE